MSVLDADLAQIDSSQSTIPGWFDSTTGGLNQPPGSSLDRASPAFSDLLTNITNFIQTTMGAMRPAPAPHPQPSPLASLTSNPLLLLAIGAAALIMFSGGGSRRRRYRRNLATPYQARFISVNPLYHSRILTNARRHRRHRRNAYHISLAQRRALQLGYRRMLVGRGLGV